MNQELIAKIEKLLALAGSANEHEARLAAAKVRELLIKHNLSRKDVDIGNYVLEEIWSGKRLPPEIRWLRTILNDYFYVRPISEQWLHGQWRLILIGTKSNAMVAHYVFDFLLRSYRRPWREYRKTRRKGRAKQSPFYKGLTIGLIVQFLAQKKALEREMGRWIVTTDPLLEAALDLHYPDRTSRKYRKVGNRASHALNAGFWQGKMLRIHKGVEGPAQHSGLALPASP